jgi:SAM-dependent methyltransferase
MRAVAWQERYMEKFYVSRPGWIGGTEEFHGICRESIGGGKILEIGAGPCNRTSDLLACLGELHGLDPDPDVQGNTALKTASVLRGDRYPYEDATFDACVSNYVIEHIPDPLAHLKEVGRVLKPGAPYVFRTPNRFHYVTLVSSLSPDWFHKAVANRLRNLGPEAHDPYPTTYMLNSRASIRRLAPKAGFAVETLHMIEKEPSYGMSSRVLFLLFTAYERIVNASHYTVDLRMNILGVLRKNSSAIV